MSCNGSSTQDPEGSPQLKLAGSGPKLLLAASEASDGPEDQDMDYEMALVWQPKELDTPKYVKHLEDTVASLSSRLEKSKNSKKRVARKSRSLMGAMFAGWKEVVDLKRDHSTDHAASNRSFIRMRDERDELYHQLQQARHELDFDRSVSNKRFVGMRDERDKLDQQLKKTQGDLDDASAKLLRIQSSIFKKTQLDFIQKDDCRIRDDVSQIWKDVRMWAKTWSSSAALISDALSQSDTWLIEKFQDHVSQVASLPEIGEIARMKHPFLILAALLSEHLRLSIFWTPFFWVANDSENAEDNLLHRIFVEMYRGQADEARTWRAQIMRLLFGDGNHKYKDEPITSPLMPRADAMSLYDRIVEEFLESETFQIMLKEMDQEQWDQCELELKRLVIRAANVYGCLQTQPDYFDWTEPKEWLCEKFSVASPHLTADRLHRIDEEGNDTTMDGKQVKIVLSSAVVAYGNSQGEDYDNERVIAKAIVYLE